MRHNLHLRYLTANEEDKEWGVKVNFVVSQEVAPGEKYPSGDHPHRYLFNPAQGRILNEYQLTYISRGSGTFYARSTGKNEPISLSEGSLFMLFPGEWHTYAPSPDTGWVEISIGFDGAIMDNLLENGFFSPSVPVVDMHNNAMVKILFEESINIASAQESGYQQLLAGMIIHLLGLISFSCKNRAFIGSNTSEKIALAKSIIENEYKTITAEELSARLNMGYSNFRRIFKKYTGFAPGKYISEIRISKAKELLTNTDMTVKEISYELGVDNYDYFTTSFRMRTGLTPLTYRAITKGHAIL